MTKGCGVVLSVLKVVHSYLVGLVGLGKETKMQVHRCVVVVEKGETGITLAAVHLSPIHLTSNQLILNASLLYVTKHVTMTFPKLFAVCCCRKHYKDVALILMCEWCIRKLSDWAWSTHAPGASLVASYR